MAPVMMLDPGGLEHGGGIGRMIGYQCAAWQAQPGREPITVVDTRGPGRLDLAPFHFAAALGRIVAAALGARPLLHIHVAGRGSTLRKVIVMHLAALLRLRRVLHLHDYDYAAFLAGLPRWTRGPIRSMFRRAHAVVVLGEADRRLVTARFGLDPARVLVVPNAAPAPAGSRRAARDEGAPVRLLFLGDPSRRKGVHDLLAALSGALLRDARWMATLAGGGRELDGFRADVAALGLGDRVALPGWLPQEHVRALLQEADVLVLPSYGEGLAMSVLEGMAHRLAVVCTPVGALAEVIVPEVCGLIVQPGDPAGLAAALLRVIQDAALRRRLGEAAYRRYAEAYDVEGYPERIAAAYAVARQA